MKNQTIYYNYKNRKQINISIMRTFPELIGLKREENKVAFNNLLLEITPYIREYIFKRIKTAVQKNHSLKNKYVPNNFINQLFIETYEHIENFSNVDEFYVWLYKKTNALLNDAISEKEFNDLFFKNIDDYSKQEWDQMEEKFIAESDGGLIMKQEFDDISHYKNPYIVHDVFIENTESELVKKTDKNLHEEQVDKHVQIALHNLPLQTRNVFELFAKHYLTIEEIAEVRNINIKDAKQLLDGARTSLKSSLFNRYPID